MRSLDLLRINARRRLAELSVNTDNKPSPLWLAVAAIAGALAVGLGAFGAHGLTDWLDGVDTTKRLAWWDTAVRYQLPHAVVLAVAALLPANQWRALTASMFTFGIVLFSGSLYAMALGAPRPDPRR